ncbi:mCG1044129, isoform CRA_a, partial [Mus musculus]
TGSGRMQDVLVRARNGVMCMLLIPALRRQRQVDLCEFLANLVYMVTWIVGCQKGNCSESPFYPIN